MRFAFVYFDEVHHVFHSVTIALALSRKLGSEHTVDLLALSDESHALLSQFCADADNHFCRVIRLSTPLSHRLWGHLRRRFPRKSRILKKHASALATYDAIVGTDYSSGKLRSILGERTPWLIFTSHGAGDRAYGYRDELRAFDLILAAGDKVRRRTLAVGLRPQAECHISGYAKFDTKLVTYADLSQLFPETSDRKTVIYNPHFAAHLSSWPSHGSAVLDFFAASDKYNLIFAPHIMLFDPRNSNRIEARWQNLPHVHIDTGSLASSDMSYTRLADVYIGDVSSQIYEFIANPRPCIFINSHAAHWRDNIDYLSWRGGDVIEPDSGFEVQLSALLEQAASAQEAKLQQQRMLFDETFSLDPTVSSSDRGANLIIDFMQRKTC